jgi:hypothetical protein
MEGKILLAQIEGATATTLTKPDLDLNRKICNQINERVDM